MKAAFVILFSLFIISCQVDTSSDQTDAGEDRSPQKEVNIESLLEESIYMDVQTYYGLAHRQLTLQNNNSITAYSYAHSASNNYLYENDISIIEDNEDFCFKLTDDGWVTEDSQLRDRHIIEDGYLTNNFDFVKSRIVLDSTTDLSGTEMSLVFESSPTWADDYMFTSGAMEYSFHREFYKTEYLINAESCGDDCYAIAPESENTFEGFINKYLYNGNNDISSGFYWLGMSLFFGHDGELIIYSYFNHERGVVSESGFWERVDVNGEEIIEISIPLEVKQEFDVSLEVDIIIAKIGGNLFSGAKFIPTSDIPAEYRYAIKGYNKTAIDDIWSAYYSSFD